MIRPVSACMPGGQIPDDMQPRPQVSTRPIGSLEVQVIDIQVLIIERQQAVTGHPEDLILFPRKSGR